MRTVRSQVAPAVADQVVSSATGLVLLLMFASLGSPRLLGLYATLMIIQGLLLGLQRAGLSDPLIIDAAGRDDLLASTFRKGLPLAMLTGGASAAAGVVAVAVAPVDATGPLLLIALAQPLNHVQDYMRSLLLGHRRATVALLGDVTWLGAFLVVPVVALLDTTQETLLLAAACANMLGVAGSALLLRVFAARCWPREAGRLPWSRMRALAAENLVGPGLIQLANFALVFLLGLEQLGLYRLAVALVTPAGRLALAVRPLYLSRLSASDARKGRRLSRVLAMALLLIVATCGWGTATVAVLALGLSVSPPILILLFAGLTEGLRAAVLALSDYVRVHRRARRILELRLLSTAFIVSALLMSGATGQALWVATAMTMAQACSVGLYIAAQRGTTGQRTDRMEGHA